MKNHFQHGAASSQRGSVAVEAAVIISFVLVPLLCFVLLFGRFFWYYTVAQKAVSDSLLYLAQAPLTDIKSRAAISLGESIITQEVADLDAETRATLSTTINCGYRIPANSTNIQIINCNGTLTPALVQTSVVLFVSDPILGTFFQSDGLPIVVTTSSRYVGSVTR